MENTPEAAPQGTEAQPTNTTPAPEAPAQAPTEAPKTNDLGLTAEQTAEFKKFVEANGGFDKSFETFKKRISEPAPEVKDAPKAPEQPANPQTAPAEPTQAPQTPAGYMSQQEFLAQQYYNSLANQKEYAPIAEQIRSGDMFKEMAKFGIRPMDQNGNINDTQVRAFFDLYAKTVPAAPAQTPDAAAAPTVDYVPVNDGKIESYAQAARIVAQSADLKAQNMAEHPQLQAAKEFIKNYLNPPKK